MSIEEQLIELVGQTVLLYGVTQGEYDDSKPLIVKQDYHYHVDWIHFTSEDVTEVRGQVIFFTQEFLEAIGAAIEIMHPWQYEERIRPEDIPDYIRYADVNPPFDPYVL